MSDHRRHLCDACLTEEYEEFRHACIHESMSKNDAWNEEYKIDDWPRWDYSMEEATLTFSEEGAAKVICSMQVVGSSQGDSWEWSWGNANFPDICRRAMQEVKTFGAEKQWHNLATLFLENDEYLGWECAAIASHVLNGVATYRCPSGSAGDYVYLVILSSRFVN
ncbi:DUF6882 domain-containing protein [Tunturiibacter lichenicola]|uniref:DUF6882 domain-containing protein n=1 Tax=Tunturiibacter lichenicola TaxID=2051959 RepID=UPI003D9B4924